jgi:hypothetical protein
MITADVVVARIFLLVLVIEEAEVERDRHFLVNNQYLVLTALYSIRCG